MITVRPSVPEDVPALRGLWKLAFGDSDAYLDNYFQTAYWPDHMLVLEEDGAVRSMAAWFDTNFCVPGRGMYWTAYLYAVATRPDCRGFRVSRSLYSHGKSCCCGRRRSAGGRSCGQRPRPLQRSWPPRSWSRPYSLRLPLSWT